VVESGWDLNELRPTAMSLEEIFLQLTGKEAPVSEEKEVAAKGRSKCEYFDYLPQRASQLFLVADCVSAADDVAVIFGFFFWNALGYFV